MKLLIAVMVSMRRSEKVIQNSIASVVVSPLVAHLHVYVVPAILCEPQQNRATPFAVHGLPRSI